MNATAENGFLPAFTADQLIEVSAKMSRKHVETLSQFCHGDYAAVTDYLDDLSQAFALGALQAAKRAEDGKAIRTMQWKYGEGYMLRRLHEIISDITLAGKTMPVDHTGGAMANGDDTEDAEEAPGYVVEGEGAVSDSLVNSENLAAAVDAFEDLPADIREVVQLRAIDGLSYEEIGKKLGTSDTYAYLKYKKGVDLMRRQFAA
jgi:RNA polymerase sigma factor (sigma-70 family)